ncbi:hypothetical protein PG991_011836 [Apiospora marii]|uniref:Uncharacterized protein n=1 Tax=Apiospora marii TaxID=335849 RepID=A0ABR1RFM2_9PEZI
MRFSSAPVLLLTAVAVKGSPWVADEPEPPAPGYGVEILQWVVEVAPGQTETLCGTVEQVYDQALQVNPGFKLLHVPSHHPEKTPYKIICDLFPNAHETGIQDGINYLRGVPGRPQNGPGPGRCGRVSCSWDSAIWWCNDNKKSRTLDSFSAIANSAQAILDQCSDRGSDFSGQGFEPSNWNTLNTVYSTRPLPHSPTHAFAHQNQVQMMLDAGAEMTAYFLHAWDSWSEDEKLGALKANTWAWCDKAVAVLLSKVSYEAGDIQENIQLRNANGKFLLHYAAAGGGRTTCSNSVWAQDWTSTR